MLTHSEKTVGAIVPQQESVFSPDTPDSMIWDAFCAGNESAFIHIYQHYFDLLYAYGWRMCKDEALVKDAIQDLFVDLRQRRERLGKTDSIKFYLFKSIRRRIIVQSGKQKAQLDGNYDLTYTFSHEEQLISQQLDEEMHAKLDKGLAQLSPRKKEVIYYFFFEGMSYQQIKEIMQLDHVKSARNLVYKALDFLKNVVGGSK
jgi:RNA polymerase sigma factor (sigma-70 family)